MTTKNTKKIPTWSHPIRIPTPIKITHTIPPVALVGEKSTWQVPFRLSKKVPPGSILKFQMCGGRNNKGDFHPFQTDRPRAAGYITARIGNDALLPLTPDAKKGTFLISLPESGLAKGTRLTITLGDRSGGGSGTTVSRMRMLNKFMVLYCVPSEQAEPKFPQWAGTSVWSKGNDDQIVAACTMHILGGPLARIRCYAPATARPGKSIRLLVRPEDKYSNLSHESPGPLEILAGRKKLAARFTPVKGSTCVNAAITLPKEGVYRLRVRDKKNRKNCVVNPIVCTARPESSVYWGMIHGHTEMSDGTGTLQQYFHQLKNETALDFAASADHDHLWETTDEYWKKTCRAVRQWNTPGQFATFLGYEWAKWRKNGDGDRNVYYLKDNRPIYRSDDGEYPAPPDLFKALKKHREKAIVIPHHTGHSGNFVDWKDHSPEHERLVEIFQLRGSYECSAKDGNPAPELATGHPAYVPGYVQNGLALGWRVGFTGGGDDHHGAWGTEYTFNRGYKQGLMSVEAEACTREAIFQAMYDRRVVATTGARILLTYNIDGRPMGSELNLRTNPELAKKRNLRVEFHGTAPLARLDILRNNKVVHSVKGKKMMDLSLTWNDTTPMAKHWMPPAKYCRRPFAFYYIRAVQTDGEAAWASPVWIDP